MKPDEKNLVGGFKHFFIFSLSQNGEDSQFDVHIFQMGWNHQPAIWHFFLGGETGSKLVGGFKHVFIFNLTLGMMIQVDTYFSNGLVSHQAVNITWDKNCWFHTVGPEIASEPLKKQHVPISSLLPGVLRMGWQSKMFFEKPSCLIAAQYGMY